MVPRKSVSLEEVAGPSWSRNSEKNDGPLKLESDETSSSELECDSSSDEDFQGEG